MKKSGHETSLLLGALAAMTGLDREGGYPQSEQGEDETSQFLEAMTGTPRLGKRKSLFRAEKPRRKHTVDNKSREMERRRKRLEKQQRKNTGGW